MFVFGLLVFGCVCRRYDTGNCVLWFVDGLTFPDLQLLLVLVWFLVIFWLLGVFGLLVFGLLVFFVLFRMVVGFVCFLVCFVVLVLLFRTAG